MDFSDTMLDIYKLYDVNISKDRHYNLLLFKLPSILYTFDLVKRIDFLHLTDYKMYTSFNDKTLYIKIIVEKSKEKEFVIISKKIRQEIDDYIKDFDEKIKVIHSLGGSVSEHLLKDCHILIYYNNKNYIYDITQMSKEELINKLTYDEDIILRLYNKFFYNYKNLKKSMYMKDNKIYVENNVDNFIDTCHDIMTLALQYNVTVEKEFIDETNEIVFYII